MSVADFVEGPARLPKPNNKSSCRALLRGETHTNLASAFIWSDSIQGMDYWSKRASGLEPISQRDRDYIMAILVAGDRG